MFANGGHFVLRRWVFCAYHDNWAVATCTKLWPDWLFFPVWLIWFIEDLDDGPINPLYKESQVPYVNGPGTSSINSSLPGQNGCHFADDILKGIRVNEKICILVEISLKFVPMHKNDNTPCTSRCKHFAFNCNFDGFKCFTDLTFVTILSWISSDRIRI